MGLRAQPAALVSGGVGRLTGRKDQWVLRTSATVEREAEVVGSAGQGAPRRIHCSRTATAGGGRASLSFGGILRSPVRRTALRSRLFSGWPGTRTGPLSPPLNSWARL